MAEVHVEPAPEATRGHVGDVIVPKSASKIRPIVQAIPSTLLKLDQVGNGVRLRVDRTLPANLTSTADTQCEPVHPGNAPDVLDRHAGICGEARPLGHRRHQLVDDAAGRRSLEP